MSPEAQAQLGHHLMTAFCKADWADCRTVVTPNVIYQESGTGYRIEGADAYLELLKGWHAALPDISVEVVNTVAEEHQAAFRVLWRGTHRGPLQTPEMTIPATGRSIEVSAVLWHQARDGRISSVFHSLDVMGLMTQLGLMDGASTPA